MCPAYCVNILIEVWHWKILYVVAVLCVCMYEGVLFWRNLLGHITRKSMSVGLREWLHQSSGNTAGHCLDLRLFLSRPHSQAYWTWGFFFKLMMCMSAIFLLTFAVSRSNLFFSLRTFRSGTSQEEFLPCPAVARLCIWTLIPPSCCHSPHTEICRTPFSLAITGLCVAFTLSHRC